MFICMVLTGGDVDVGSASGNDLMLSMVVVMMMRSIGLNGKQVDNIDDICAVAVLIMMMMVMMTVMVMLLVVDCDDAGVCFRR